MYQSVRSIDFFLRTYKSQPLLFINVSMILMRERQECEYLILDVSTFLTAISRVKPESGCQARLFIDVSMVLMRENKKYEHSIFDV